MHLGTALVADEDPELVEGLRTMLADLGWDVRATACEGAAAGAAMQTHRPDIVVIGVHEDRVHALDLVEAVSGLRLAPVIAALEHEDADFVAEAADRGVVAYASDRGREALRAAVELARRRHAEQVALGAQIAGMERRLRSRAEVDLATGMLMERHGIGRQEAYERIRRHARDHRRSVREVAAAVQAGSARI